MKYRTIVIFIFCHLSSFGQQRKCAYITDRNFNQIKLLQQLKFIEDVESKLQVIIKKIQNTENSLELDSLVENLVALKTAESFLFVANYCCRYIDYSKPNEFTLMARKINRQATYKALNKFYLENFYEAGFHPVLYHALIYESIREKYKSKMDSSCFYRSQVTKNDIKKVENDCFIKIQINDENINHMDQGFYKFEFLNNPPQNRLDTLVNKIENLVLKGRNTDTTTIKLTIDSIGQLKTQSAYCYLYTFAFRKRYAFIHDLNPMDGVIERFGGLKAINTITSTEN